MTPAGEHEHPPIIKRPRLRLSVPTIGISRLSSRLSSPRKENGKVSSSGRGGSGNIHATNSHQLESRSLALQPSPNPPSLLSARLTSTSESGSSGVSLNSICSGADKRISASTGHSKFSWNRSTRSVASGSFDNDRFTATSSHCGSPTIPPVHTRGRDSLDSVNTFGITQPFKSTRSASVDPSIGQRRSSTSLAYSRHLADDTAIRAEEKRRRTAGDELRKRDGATSEPMHIRTGRGGAGMYTEAKANIDAGLFPTTAALTREHELRQAAQERLLIEASRARAAETRRTGRGGLGNIGRRRINGKQYSGTKDKNSAPALVKFSARAKGKRKISPMGAYESRDGIGHDRNGVSSRHTHRRFGSSSSHSSSFSTRRSVSSKSSLAVRGKGLNRLWATVTNVHTRRSRLRSREAVKFEIVELNPEFEYDKETNDAVSDEQDTITCILSASAVASASRTAARALLERRCHTTQLEEVPEEESWTNSSSTSDIVNFGLRRELSLVSTNPESEEGPPASNGCRFGIEPRIAESEGGVTSNRPLADVRRNRDDSCDSIGTFGRKDESVIYGEGEDDAESTVDPYMHYS